MLKTSVKLYGTVKDINDRTDLIPVDGELVEVYGVKYNNPTLAATLWKLV